MISALDCSTFLMAANAQQEQYTIITANHDPFSASNAGGRDLWTCDLDCHQCVALTDRRYCAMNNQQGTCCTKTDGRAPCMNEYRNCTDAIGYNTTNNFAYVVCGYNETVCGVNPAPVNATDYERDIRFGKNFILARTDPVTITTPIGYFLKNKRCTWVIKKSFYKQGLSVWVTANAGVTITYFKGG